MALALQSMPLNDQAVAALLMMAAVGQVAHPSKLTAAVIRITGSPQDYHPDHEAISLLVRDACFTAPVANYRTGGAAALPGIPSLYFTDAIG